MIRERLIHLHYEDNTVQGYSGDEEQIKAFFSALGKISAYGLSKNSCNGPVDYLSISIDRNGNFAANYYKSEDTVAGLRKSAPLWEKLSLFQEQESHVITAKLDNSENDYTFEIVEARK